MSGKAFWGPYFWTVKHYIALKGENGLYASLVECFKVLVPCEKCRIHYVSNNQTCNLNSYNKTQESLFYHSYKLHDMVNLILDKKSPSFEESKKYFYSLPEEKYEEAMWNVLYVCAATYQPSNASVFKEFFAVLIKALKKKSDYIEFVGKWNINSYLTNSRDLFLFVYMLQQYIYRERMVLSPYLMVKSYYFGKVGEECKDCKV